MEMIFERFPLQSIRFFQKALIFGFIGGLSIASSCVYLLLHNNQTPAIVAAFSSAPSTSPSPPSSPSSPSNASCIFPLSLLTSSCPWLSCDSLFIMWLTVRIVLFLVLAPFRLHMFVVVCQAYRQPDREAVVRKLLELCQSFSWKFSQIASIALYLWVMMAFVFNFFTQFCEGEAGRNLNKIGVANLFVIVVHFFFSMLWVRSLAINRIDDTFWKSGASQRQIEENTTLLAYTPDNPIFKEAHLSCCICLDEYVAADAVRQMPCNHMFHSRCLDPWLAMKKACPLCQRSITEKPHTD